MRSGINPHKGHNTPDSERLISVIQCLPFYSVLRSLGNPKVHLFSLDVEDSEADILNTIPWDKVDIHVFLVEYGGYEYRSEAIKPILLRNNYVLIGTVKEKDFLFVRKDVLGSYDTDLNNFISFYPPKE